jgi:NADP-dependent 3-hydroxy acid dehydrogenase YdfG
LDRLESLASRIAGAGGEVACVQTEVRRREDLTNLVKLARDRYGQLGALISNAGVMPGSPLDDLRVEDWENMIDINIKGVLYGIAAALPVFRQQGFGQGLYLRTGHTFREVRVGEPGRNDRHAQLLVGACSV